MKITCLHLKNFRQFYGKSLIEFAHEENAGITVVHGENGSGKTSLLNAFKWVLYGTTDFDTGESTILNERALAETTVGATVPMEIRLEFEHESTKYVVTRTQNYKRDSKELKASEVGKSVPKVTCVDSKGQYRESANPANEINQLIPEKMHSYFFFNGERIDRLANVSASGEIQDAIRTLMGLELVERANDHLRRLVISELRKEASESASADYQQLSKEVAKKIEERDDYEDRRRQASANVEGFKRELSSINAAFQEISEIKIKVEKRNSLEQLNEMLVQELKEIEGDITELIAKSGSLAFLKDTMQSVKDTLDECRKRGELPSNIRRTFIDDLLHRCECICKTSLSEGSNERMAVEEYRNKAAGEDIEEAYTRVVGNLDAMARERQNLYEKISDLKKREVGKRQAKVDNDGALDEVGKEFEASELQDVRALQERKLKIDSHLLDETVKVRECETRIAEFNSEIAIGEREVEKVTARSEKEKLARKRLTFAQECQRVIQELHSALAEQTRKDISDKVNETFQAILWKDFYAKVDVDYTLRIYKKVAGVGEQEVFEKSTGENQVISLSFIASLVNIAKEKSQSKSFFFKGGVYPIVMDSPFGSLDRTYREKVSEYIPKLAEQVVVFASNSQWSKEVETKCRPYIGKEYSLAPVSKQGKQEGSNFKQAYGTEFTEIKEGNHER